MGRFTLVIDFCCDPSPTSHWPPLLQEAAADSFAFQQMMAELLKFSLVKRLMEEHALSIHRLVQAVQRDRMDLETQHHWAERAVRALNAVFPDRPKDLAVWPQCLRYLDQAQACHALIEHYGLAFVEAASVLNRTGLYLHDHALYAIAKPLYQRALAICEQQLGPQHPDTAISLNNLAELYRSQGKYEQAEPLYQRTLAIREQQLGPQHPQTAQSLNNLGYLYDAQGKYEQAEPLYVRALAIREQQLGPQHPDTAISLNNLAALYQVQGKYEQAEPLYERALAIREQQLGPQHLNTQTVRGNYAALLRSMGRDAEAKKLEEDS